MKQWNKAEAELRTKLRQCETKKERDAWHTSKNSIIGRDEERKKRL